MQVLEFETVVVGSGLAGLTSALHASRYGEVAIITKSGLDISNSYNAQGGIAAAIDKDDSVGAHMHDSMEAGRGLCDKDAMDILVKEGRNSVSELIELGMPFDTLDNKIVLGLEGGHSKRRILHAEGDATGKVLTRFMLERIKNITNIHAFENTTVVNLLVHNNRCSGVHALEFKSQKNFLFRSKAVILATGGLARIYLRTTNPHTATGDGYALAYRAGAQLADMEFVQFHPTALRLGNTDAFLISEAIRGEGARLINNKGERFMKAWHPLAELAPRDLVSYAIFKEMQATNTDHVFLSLKHLEAKKIQERFSHINKRLRESGLDFTKDNIPVAPAAHYTIGGVKTDLNGHTSINHLFAAGEVASTGVMGANRIASNSLLECLVFGKRAGIAAGEIRRKEPFRFNCTEFQLDTEHETLFLERKNQIAAIMNSLVGIVRSRQGLQMAIERLEKIRDEFATCTNQYNLCKIKNGAELCLLIARAALLREESRGGHIREDFRSENPDLKVHIIQQRDKNIQFEPIRS